MGDQADTNRMHSTPLPSLSIAQRAFVNAAETLGATAPGTARPLAELPRLSSAELDDLVDAGLVREAADWRYYVFRSRRALAWPSAGPAPVGNGSPMRWTRGRYGRTLLFWVLVILIPIIFLQLTGRR